MKRWTIWLAAAIGLVACQAWADPAPVSKDGKPRLLVAFKQGVTPAERAAVLAGMGLDPADALDELNTLVAEAQPGKVQPNAAFRLMSNPKVLWVEEDFYANWLLEAPSLAQLSMPPVHEFFAGAPKLAEPKPRIQGELPWGITRVKAPEAWARQQGAGVRVAVIDTGIDSKHPDLAGSYAGGYNAVDSGKPPMDDNGHGTHVAGTIAAAKDGKGVVGIAPKAKLYAVKVLDAEGSGSLVGIIKGIIWCARNDIQVANMSLGAPVGTMFMHWAIMYANMKGVTVVAAAGNSGGSVSYPGAYNEVLAVSAADIDDKITEWSSRGKEVDLIAPGHEVWSDAPGGGLAMHSGTSMATPHVAGLAALAVGQGAKSPAAVRSALVGAAESLGLGPELQGAGMVNAGKLVKK